MESNYNFITTGEKGKAAFDDALRERIKWRLAEMVKGEIKRKANFKKYSRRKLGGNEQ